MVKSNGTFEENIHEIQVYVAFVDTGKSRPSAKKTEKIMKRARGLKTQGLQRE